MNYFIFGAKVLLFSYMLGCESDFTDEEEDDGVHYMQIKHFFTHVEVRE